MSTLQLDHGLGMTRPCRDRKHRTGLAKLSEHKAGSQDSELATGDPNRPDLWRAARGEILHAASQVGTDLGRADGRGVTGDSLHC